ncbi:glycosyltransferase family 9 protein [Helicobacter sp. 11S02596-1]|uniref:glycosyltransferase family 9 protein n=1 Tax=Helicobacter sp. 11S02596-1 TaxID=1476194 RepID=UPI000BA7CD6D|nr:glycosyltransferase family 9 protein [Helicobacter sp. 11S02596-1]PAF43932.1 hypothetical protein BJI48_03850 [Helicobacter sp. 11S02596-1]
MKKIAFESTAPLKILLFRTDRIGDVVLTLPCIQALKTTYPNSYICLALQSYTAPLVENNPFLDDIICVDKCSQKEFTALIKAKRFDVSVSFFASKIACYAPFLAKIPVRIGPLSKLRALLFTHKIRQKRSLGEQNEAQYNLDLLKLLGSQTTYFPKITLTEEEKSAGKAYVKAKFGTNTKPLFILHPGSGGSSKDWSVPNYFLLAEKILSNHLGNVLITGSGSELTGYEAMLSDYPLLKSSHLLDGQKPLREFLGIIACGDVFLSNSTGPLHCASALGVKTIGFYPLTQACKPQRWGAFAQDMHRHITLTPQKERHDPKTCGDVAFEECMALISIEDALGAIEALAGLE